MATTAQELKLHRQAFQTVARPLDTPAERKQINVGGGLKKAGRTVAHCVGVFLTPRRRHFDTVDNINFAQLPGWGQNRR